MTGKNTGGYAFPAGSVRKMRARPGDAGSDWVTVASETATETGMTLRDYFAASATEDDLCNHTFTGQNEQFVQDNADGTKSVRTRPVSLTREQAKYHYADAMLKARQS